MTAEAKPVSQDKANSKRAETQGVVAALLQLAQDLNSIRSMWIQGDRKARELETRDVAPETGGYERIIRGDARDGIDRKLAVLRLDASPLRTVLANADPNLRDRILRAISDSALDACVLDRDGKETSRWRQSWAETGLDREYEELIALLRAAADATESALGPPDEQHIPRKNAPRNPDLLRLFKGVSKLPKSGVVRAPDVYKALNKSTSYLRNHENRGKLQADPLKLDIVGHEGDRPNGAKQYSRESFLRWAGHHLGLSEEERRAAGAFEGVAGPH